VCISKICGRKDLPLSYCHICGLSLNLNTTCKRVAARGFSCGGISKQKHISWTAQHHGLRSASHSPQRMEEILSRRSRRWLWAFRCRTDYGRPFKALEQAKSAASQCEAGCRMHSCCFGCWSFSKPCDAEDAWIRQVDIIWTFLWVSYRHTQADLVY